MIGFSFRLVGLLGITLDGLVDVNIGAVDVVEHDKFSFHSVDRKSPLSGHI